jgi:UTP--glucose-1-phosphate uridylyltransferase
MWTKKAVITAAGAAQRRLPLQTLVDRDGVSRTVLALLVREVLSARIEQIGVVVSPGDEALYAEAVPDYRDALCFIPQHEPRGYGDALWHARDFVGSDSFLHLVGDHVYLGRPDGCAAELTRVAESEAACVSAVRATPERLLSSFGVVGGRAVAGRPGLYHVDTVLEKPTPTVAEQRVIVPGLRSGHYLAFFGMHVLTPSVLDAIGRMMTDTPERPVTLSDALAAIATQQKYLAFQVNAERYDLGAKYGLLTSQLALALASTDRDEVLSMLVTMLANEQQFAQEAAR